MSKSSILSEIFEYKKKEVASKRALYPTALLEKSVSFQAPTVSLVKYLQRADKAPIIAEFKRKSPSKGSINTYAKAREVSMSYMQAGAAALSILTDTPFFGGSLNDLKEARAANYCPILRKDFIVDDYQVLEARSYGADVVLLIGKMLDKKTLQHLSELAFQLEMEVLYEIHDEEDLDRCPSLVSMLGVNHRNLSTFSVDTTLASKLFDRLPTSLPKIAESGIQSASEGAELLQMGYQGLLIGEAFMKNSKPGLACSHFIQQLQSLRNYETIPS